MTDIKVEPKYAEINPVTEYVLTMPPKTAYALAFALGPLVGVDYLNSGLGDLWSILCMELNIDAISTTESLTPNAAGSRNYRLQFPNV